MTTTALDRRTSLSIFERMLMIRHFEEAVIQLYKQGRFVSHYHIYIGQEATGGAVLEALGEKDLICTTHRNHGHVIGRGCDPNRAMAEILGRATGFNGGRSGTLHISDPSRGFLSTSAIVGGCAGLATGAGYGIKVKREPHVAVGFFGDGSLEEGLVIECFNIAALWKLPVVYVCENNSPGAMGPQQGGYPTATTATDSFTQRNHGIDRHIEPGGCYSDRLGATRVEFHGGSSGCARPVFDYMFTGEPERQPGVSLLGNTECGRARRRNCHPVVKRQSAINGTGHSNGGGRGHKFDL